MKKILIVPLLAALVAGSSCNKEQHQPFKESQNFDDNVKSVLMNASAINEYTYADLANYTEEVQKYVFQHMSPEAQANVWKDKMDFLITTDYKNDTAMINLLTEIRNYMSEDLYNGNTPADYSQKENYFVSKMVSQVGYEGAQIILTTMQTMSGQLPLQTLPGPEYNPPTGAPQCSCSTGSDWCGSGFFCKYSKDRCLSSNKGCGTFWTWGCDGRCTNGG